MFHKKIKKLTSALVTLSVLLTGQTFTAAAEESEPLIGLSVINISAEQVEKNPEIPVSLIVSGVEGKYAVTEIWTSFDDRLEIETDNSGEPVVAVTENSGGMLVQTAPSRYLDNSTSEIVDLNGVRFISSSSENTGKDGTLFKVNVKLPEDVKAGDEFPLKVVPVGRETVNNDFVDSVFTNADNDSEGKSMQEKIFSQGICNGCIRIVGDSDTISGDANCDGIVTIADSVSILQYLANSSEYPLSETAMTNADINNVGDGVNVEDALLIQKYDAGIVMALSEK